MQFWHLVKQICPLLLPMSARDLNDYTKQERDLVSKELGDVNHVHSLLGTEFSVGKRGMEV